MDIILLENIGNLGGLGDKVTVKAGYGRNYLIPQGKAVPATEANVAEFEARRADLERAAAEALTAAQSRAEALAALDVLTIEANAGEEGKLFGSIGTRDIAEVCLCCGLRDRQVRSSTARRRFCVRLVNTALRSRYTRT